VRKSNKIYVSNLNPSVPPPPRRPPTMNSDAPSEASAPLPMSASNTEKTSASPSSSSQRSLRPKPPSTSTPPHFMLNPQGFNYLLPSPILCSMNGKTVGGQEIKVQFARGGNDRRGFGGDRGRGRPYGDRGGYQSRGDYADRPPRRDFGDRPRGCFNCGEEGHMIKDCPKRTLSLI
jgi:hypothetical protein